MNINTILQTPLRISELKNIGSKFGLNVNVVLYDRLINGEKLHNLFQKYPSGFVLFYPNQKSGNHISGHYVALFKRGNTVYFYDSYGDPVDSQKQNVPQRHQLYQERNNSLIRQLLEHGYNVDYSPYKHQLISNDSSTCGRHSILRLLFPELNTNQYHKQLMKVSKTFGLNPDELVSHVIQ